MNKKSGYIEKKIGENIIPFKFGMNAFAKFCELQNINLAQMGIVLQPNLPALLSAMRDLLYSAAYAAIKSEGKEVTFTPETVGDWIDEMPQSDFNEILETMQSAKLMGNSLSQVVEKKTITTKKK